MRTPLSTRSQELSEPASATTPHPSQSSIAQSSQYYEASGVGLTASSYVQEPPSLGDAPVQDSVDSTHIIHLSQPKPCSSTDCNSAAAQRHVCPASDTTTTVTSTQRELPDNLGSHDASRLTRRPPRAPTPPTRTQTLPEAEQDTSGHSQYRDDLQHVNTSIEGHFGTLATDGRTGYPVGAHHTEPTQITSEPKSEHTVKPLLPSRNKSSSLLRSVYRTIRTSRFGLSLHR